MRIEAYLDQIMRKHGYKRDKQLAEWLGVTPVSISNYRSGERSMENEKCVKIALELAVDPMQVIMAVDLDRAERHGQKSLWEVFMNRTTAVAASLLLATSVNLFLTPKNAEASTYKPYSVAEAPGQSILCQMLFVALAAYAGQWQRSNVKLMTFRRKQA
ncbi:Cro/Cl family transcriptional regulator [Pseudoduganella sp. R-34]|uniref:Cro/Cl family transcriptional regulator n=1 Tax=Pseudoduganella sp. R-34 TaxID=3404062 RepID=UPI003CF23DC8